jgi:U3 small nucleolar ribonucleoprotein protein IMP4
LSRKSIVLSSWGSLLIRCTFSFKNIEDTIEVRHHVFVKTGYQAVELAEVGPRMSMRLFEIRAGTLENKEGDVEWHLNQYTRTGRKKEYL